MKTSNKPFEPRATGNSGRSHDTALSSPLLDNTADSAIGTVNNPQVVDNIHCKAPPFNFVFLNRYCSIFRTTPKTFYLGILLFLIYWFIGFFLLGCASMVPERPMAKPWNFPPLREWNAPFEFAWQNGVDNWRKLTVKRTKTIEGMVYEYDEVTQLYFPDLIRYAEEPQCGSTMVDSL